MSHKLVPLYIGDGEYYTRTDTDNVIAEKDAEIAKLKNGIAPKQSDKTLQERLNEVCKKHAVSTLQDLDWAFCESEKRRARDFIEADKVIAEKDAEIAKLKNSIAPKQSDKTLQERLNEVCKKHAVSTLQDLDWAFCESEKRRARDFIEAVKAINHHKYKRCLAMADMCKARYDEEDAKVNGCGASWEYISKEMKYWERWQWRWEELAEKFKPNKSTAQ